MRCSPKLFVRRLPGFRRSMAFLFILICAGAAAQPGSRDLKWTGDGNAFYKSGPDGGIVLVTLPDKKETVVVAKEQLIPAGQSKPLPVRNFSFSGDGKRVMIYTNAKRVWRYDTRGDYWVLDLQTKTLKQLGKPYPPSSLMFAKFSPDGSKVAYVSEHNIYMEDLATDQIMLYTSTNGTRKLINGTFDWVYEEELDCRDGFRWSPDGKHIAFWQIDANKIRDYLMLNTTDSIYPFVVPVEYPKVGEAPSPYKIGVIDVSPGTTGTGGTIPVTKWMEI